MISKFLILFTFIIAIFGLLLLFFLKTGTQLQYLRVKKGKKKGEWTDVFQFFSREDKELRNASFMLFPLLFPIELNEKKEELNDLKRRVKKINIGLYLCIMVIFALGAYTSIKYPEGLF